MNVIIDDKTLTPTDLGIDPRNKLTCGGRVPPDGDLVVPVPLKGNPRTEICENPATYVVGKPRVVEREKEVLTDELEWTTETYEHDELALLSCGIHTERAVEHWQHHERIGDTGYPPVTELTEADDDK